MSTAVSTITQVEIDALAAQMGMSQNTGEYLPVLKINYNAEDENEKRLPLGQFVVTDQEIPIYAKKVRIRPLAMHYQYQQYDADANKMVNQTVLNTNFRQEFLDEKGTVRCGRPDSKSFRDMSDERKKMYSDITCTRQIRCLVSYEGEDKDGNKHKVENLPAVLRLRGANFMPYEEEFEKRLPKGRKPWDYWAELTLKRQKNGSVTYYIISFDPDLNNPVALDMDTIDTIKHFSSLVEEENDAIIESHKAALAEKTRDSSVYDAVADDAPLDDDFDDDIPF